jgi:predicted nucleic acid-binding protein
MTALIDTGFMLAVLSVNDSRHKACSKVARHEQNALLPSVVLPELAYLAIRDLGHLAFVKFMRQLLKHSGQLIQATEIDFLRAADIMEKYADSKIDFVDCVIVAMAERLNISRILTVDQRDFRILRPNHISAFEILPS